MLQRICLVILLFFASAQMVGAIKTGKLVGNVVDGVTGEPIQGVTI